MERILENLIIDQRFFLHSLKKPVYRNTHARTEVRTLPHNVAQYCI